MLQKNTVSEDEHSDSEWGGGGGGGDLYLTEGFFALSVWAAYIWRGLLSEFYGILFKPFSSLFKIYLLRL